MNRLSSNCAILKADLFPGQKGKKRYVCACTIQPGNLTGRGGERVNGRMSQGGPGTEQNTAKFYEVGSKYTQGHHPQLFHTISDELIQTMNMSLCQRMCVQQRISTRACACTKQHVCFVLCACITDQGIKDQVVAQFTVVVLEQDVEKGIQQVLEKLEQTKARSTLTLLLDMPIHTQTYIHPPPPTESGTNQSQIHTNTSTGHAHSYPHPYTHQPPPHPNHH